MYEEFASSASQNLAIGLAPMEGVSDFAFRMWLSAICPFDFLVTPFLRATAGYDFRSVPPLFCPEIFDECFHKRLRVIPQFMGSSPEDLCKVALPFLDHSPYVDINCGCPSATVFRNGAGSALLKDPNRFFLFLKCCEEILGQRKYSVKLRVGVASPAEFADLLSALEQLKPALITVHGRTQKEGYTGLSRWDLIQQAAVKLPCPVYGSGDVVDSRTLLEKRAVAPAIQGIMIGRGAIANPWVFWNLKYLNCDCGSLSQQQSNTNVEFGTLYWALGVFALFQEAQFRGPDSVLHVVRTFRPWELLLGVDVQAWQDFYEKLSAHLFVKILQPKDLTCDERVISRLKQITKLLKVGNNSIAQTKLLRTASVAGFFAFFESAVLEKEGPLG